MEERSGAVAARKRRLIKFRTVAPPTALETMKPARGKP
jgi:hypothetical protein